MIEAMVINYFSNRQALLIKRKYDEQNDKIEMFPTLLIAKNGKGGMKLKSSQAQAQILWNRHRKQKNVTEQKQQPC